MRTPTVRRQHIPGLFEERRDLRAELVLVAIVVLWAFNFTAVRYSLTHGMKPLVYAPLRWVIATAIFSLVTWRLEGSLRIARRHWPMLLFLTVIGLWVNQIGFSYSIHVADAAPIALLFGTLPVFIAVTSQLRGLERLHGREWAALVVAFVGVALIALGGGGKETVPLKGVLLAMLTAGTFAVYSVFSVPLMRQYSPYRISAVTAVFGTVLLAGTGSWQLSSQNWNFGALVWGGMLWGALASTAIGNLLWFKVIGRVGPGRAALYLNLQPLLGAVFAVIILSESLKPLQIGGAAVIFAGIAMSRSRPTPAPPAE